MSRARRTLIDFDGLMRRLMGLGFIALAAWVAAGAFGLVGGYVVISPSATLRFLLAVLVLVFARRTYWGIREWRWRKLPADERYGFSSPLWEHARSSEALSIHEEDLSVQATTGSPQPQG